ncbi:hypothetical protein [Bermanella marisrubri]|uniref:Excinuclease ABC subunit B n=1 Tax=Bermanella marisrubri TaxID=207949 RepID=Q1N5Z0_9GAMM|nr:hypothetical protein [Bermanella marisrubri]EAT13802.1 excinuclease ABC subunit B [Oceanobacter sp. RED65] [Bermanella marisrubri]
MRANRFKFIKDFKYTEAARLRDELHELHELQELKDQLIKNS